MDQERKAIPVKKPKFGKPQMVDFSEAIVEQIKKKEAEGRRHTKPKRQVPAAASAGVKPAPTSVKKHATRANFSNQPATLETAGPVSSTAQTQPSSKKKKPGKLKQAILSERSERCSRHKDRCKSLPNLMLLDETSNCAMPVNNFKQSSPLERQSRPLGCEHRSFSVPHKLDKCSVVFDAVFSSEVIADKDDLQKLAVQHAAGHSRKWRPYCDHLSSPELNKLARTVLTKLEFFQARKWKQDVRKAKLRRRYLCGLNEVRHHIRLKYERFALIILAPDAEVSQKRNGLYEIIRLIQLRARMRSIPIVYALNRYEIGRLMKKRGPVMAVLVYGGGLENTITDELLRIKQLLPDLQAQYRTKLLKALKLTPSNFPGSAVKPTAGTTEENICEDKQLNTEFAEMKIN